MFVLLVPLVALKAPAVYIVTMIFKYVVDFFPVIGKASFGFAVVVTGFFRPSLKTFVGLFAFSRKAFIVHPAYIFEPGIVSGKEIVTFNTVL